MYTIELTKEEVNNLLAFLTGKGRMQLTGDEAFEFVRIASKFINAEPKVEEETEWTD